MRRFRRVRDGGELRMLLVESSLVFSIATAAVPLLCIIGGLLVVFPLAFDHAAQYSASARPYANLAMDTSVATAVIMGTAGAVIMRKAG